MTETVQQLLRGRINDDSVGVKHEDREWTWREHLHDASAQHRRCSRSLTPTRPMHVGVLLDNTPDMLTQMAAAGLGRSVVRHRHHPPRQGSAGRRAAGRLPKSWSPTPNTGRCSTGLTSCAIRLVDTSSGEWRHRVDAAGELQPHRETTATDTFMMIFTSGTSGNPKAVQVAHAMVLFARARP